MNIFAGLTKYANSYSVVESRPFNTEELASISSAKVVTSQYGLSCCFFMKSGCQQYIPLSRDTVANPGDTVDFHTVKVLTLTKDGEDPILRIEF